MRVDVTVRLPAALRELADGRPAVILPVHDGDSTRALLRELAVRHPLLHRRLCDDRGELRRYVNVYVGEEDVRLCGLDAPLPAGAQLLVIPSVAGG
ncbi:MoaD/ThiS family protein [Motilibacter deserti]|uniref:MoaD/ThiS family protein n=1 Tax=Motilibacter deserti TaxID=2714956 RepID=UPI002F2B8EAF